MQLHNYVSQSMVEPYMWGWCGNKWQLIQTYGRYAFMLRTCHRVESSITDVYNKQQAYHSYKLLKCQTSELKNPEMDFFLLTFLPFF